MTDQEIIVRQARENQEMKAQIAVMQGELNKVGDYYKEKGIFPEGRTDLVDVVVTVTEKLMANQKPADPANVETVDKITPIKKK